MLDGNDLERMIEHEKRRTALEYQHETFADALSDGIEVEIMAEAAIATALGELLATVGEDDTLARLDALRERVIAGAFQPRTLQ